MKFKPQTKDELYKIIKKIVTNQEKNSSYRYGLKDVDTSLINDMADIFSCYDYNYINFEINRKIDWNDPRNDITSWNVSSVTNMYGLFTYSTFNQNISNWNIKNVTNMESIFEKSQFNQNLSKWIFTLNRDCNLYDFNFNSYHSKKFDKINYYEDFIKIHITKDFINNIFKNGNDIEQFKLLKILKQYRNIFNNLNIETTIKNK